MRIRPALAAEWAREQDWLDALPDLVHVCREQWGLAHRRGAPLGEGADGALRAGGRPFERRLRDEALAVLRSADGSTRALVNQDLHGANILRADRAPWLVIDPKPLVGEPELDGVGLLRNARSAGSRSNAGWTRSASSAGTASGCAGGASRTRWHGRGTNAEAGRPHSWMQRTSSDQPGAFSDPYVSERPYGIETRVGEIIAPD